MNKTNLTHAIGHFQEIADKVRDGEEFLIEENGKPFAKVTPVPQLKLKKSGVRRFGLVPDLEMADNFDDPLPDDFAFPFGNAK